MNKLKSLSYFAVGIAVILSISAESYATGYVSGTVTNASSNPVSDAVVMARLNGVDKGSDTTGDSGSYAIYELVPGTYEIHVIAHGYELRIEKNVVVINNENTVKDITNLTIEGIISGKVTKSDGTTPIANVIVRAIDSSGFTGIARTNINGNYTIDKLPEGTFTVKGAKHSSYTFSESQNVQVISGQTTSNVNLTGTNGKISGIITESDGTTPIVGAHVTAEDYSGKMIASDITDSRGYYALTGLSSENYNIKAWRTEGPIAEASNVPVIDGQTTIRHLSAAGGSISGNVKNSSQNPVQGAILTARKDNSFYSTTSDADGNYKIKALTAGTYEVTINPNGNDYAADKIDSIIVTAGQETSGQNFSLVPAGKITGTVKDDSQIPIEGAHVSTVDSSRPEGTYIPTTTDTNGNYTVNYLLTGTYTIFVSSDEHVSGLETDVSVTAGQTTSGKNFSLGTSGGTISGTVYKSDGTTPIEGAMVQCTSENKSWGGTSSDSSGCYSLTLLQAGLYTVRAYAVGYEMETLNNVEVSVPYENSGNDFTLDTKQ